MSCMGVASRGMHVSCVMCHGSRESCHVPCDMCHGSRESWHASGMGVTYEWHAGRASGIRVVCECHASRASDMHQPATYQHPSPARTSLTSLTSPHFPSPPSPHPPPLPPLSLSLSPPAPSPQTVVSMVSVLRRFNGYMSTTIPSRRNTESSVSQRAPPNPNHPT